MQRELIEFKKCRVFFVSLILLSFFDIVLSSEFIFPLKENYGLSSSFGEYREGHFHAGIDVRTGGRIGIPVYASNDGRIYRICVNRRGFGKAVYIRHEDDIITVYGHLDKFENETLKLEDIVDRERKLRGKKYPGNIFIDIPVKKGQLIGYSGETGAGLPHLHFEVRKGESNPINPLTYAVSYPDRLEPKIQNIIIKPIGATSYIDSSHEAQKIILTKEGDIYKSKRTPVICGKFETLAAMYDRIGCYYKVGVYGFSCFLDGELIYKADFSRISYENWSTIGFVFDHGFTLNGKGYYKLFRQKGNDLPIGNDFGFGSGVIDCDSLPEGRHVLLLKVFDVSGNNVTCQISFVSRKKCRLTYSAITELLGGRAFKTGEIFLQPYENFALYFFKGAGSFNLKAISPDGGISFLSPTLIKDGIYYGEFNYKSGLSGDYRLVLEGDDSVKSSRTLTIESILPETERKISFEGFSLFIPKDAVFEDLFLFYEEVDKPSPSALPQIGSGIKLNPIGFPFGKKVRLEFNPPDEIPLRDISRAGVYRYDREHLKWEYVDAIQDEIKKNISAYISWLDIYSLIVDKSPPLLYDVMPSYNKHTRDRYPRLFARAKDIGSGIDFLSLLVTLDGKVVDAEFDPDRGWFSHKLQRPLLPGRHTMKINIKDKAGNKAKEAVSIFFVD